MTQLSNNSENYERFNSIVNRSTWIGSYTPFVSWAWQEVFEPIKLIPIAFKQVRYEDRPISSLLLPFGLIIFLIIGNVFYM